MRKTAFISPCGTWRYVLTREWDQFKPKLYFVMLNPSTADDKEDDPTIRRCLHFAQKPKGEDGECIYGGLVVVNLFAYRATEPDELRQFYDKAIGPDNDRVLAKALKGKDVVCAWGTRGTLAFRSYDVWPVIKEQAANVYSLRTTKDGHPSHPLYLPNSCELTEYHHPADLRDRPT